MIVNIAINIIEVTATIDLSLLIFLIANNLVRLMDSFVFLILIGNIGFKNNNYQNNKAPKNSPCLKEGKFQFQFT